MGETGWDQTEQESCNKMGGREDETAEKKKRECGGIYLWLIHVLTEGVGSACIMHMDVRAAHMLGAQVIAFAFAFACVSDVDDFCRPSGVAA